MLVSRFRYGWMGSALRRGYDHGRKIMDTFQVADSVVETWIG